MFCSDCQERYDEYLCSRCGQRVVYLRGGELSNPCCHCVLRARLNELPNEDREAIRGLVNSGRRIEAIKEARRILELSIGDASFVVEQLREEIRLDQEGKDDFRSDAYPFGR